MSNIFLVAIVYTPGDPRGDFKKYIHGIKNTIHYKTKFCADMKRKFPTTQHVNFYQKEKDQKGKFIERYYLN